MSTDQLDLSMVQLVADTTRLAAEGRALGPNRGHFIIQMINTHTASLDITSLLNPYLIDPPGSLNGDIPGDFDLWLLDCWISRQGEATGSFTGGRANVSYASTAGAVDPTLFPTFDEVTSKTLALVDQENAAGTGNQFVEMSLNDTTDRPNSVDKSVYPIWLPRPCAFTFRSVVAILSAERQYGANYHVQMLPRGVVPGSR